MDAKSLVDEYVGEKDPALPEIVKALQALVKQAAPDAVEGLNAWDIPTFEYHGPLCYYMMATRHVTFGFHRGAQLYDPAGLLEGTGKSLRHVKIRTLQDINRSAIRGLVEAAAKLNREDPKPGKKI